MMIGGLFLGKGLFRRCFRIRNILCL